MSAIEVNAECHTILFMSWLSALGISQFSFAEATCVAEYVAVEAPERRRHKQCDIHSQVPHCGYFRNFWRTEGYKQSICGYFGFPCLDVHTMHVSHSLLAKLVLDFSLAHALQLPTTDDSLAGVEGAMRRDVHRSVHKNISASLLQSDRRLFRRTFHKEASISLAFNAIDEV